MTKEPTLKEVHVWIAQEIRDTQKLLLNSQEKYIHRNFIRMMKAVYKYLGQPPAPKVVTREKVATVVLAILGILRQPQEPNVGEIIDAACQRFVDLGFVVEEKP